MQRSSLDPGQYAETVTLTGFRTNVASVTIPVGGRLVHDVTLARAVLGSITGTVTDDNGAALDATVAIPGASTRTDANGSFTVANVPPGTYKATASAGRHYTVDTETVTVNEGQATVVNFILTLKSIRLADHTPTILEDGLAS
jgi:Carboxypeptidase regulatory-like domain